jgi:hypothetical protein
MIDEDYGQWALQCINCHNPHRQDQYRDHDPESRLEEGTPVGRWMNLRGWSFIQILQMSTATAF